MSPRLRGPIRILSIDGGGIRGYVPALVLADMERRRGSLGRGDALASRFDLIAGTSTGALIALALATPKAPAPSSRGKTGMLATLLGRPAPDLPRRFDCAEIAGFYEKRGVDFFPRSRIESLDVMRQAVGSKYDARPLERFLAEAFGELLLSEAANAVLATAYDAERGEALVMKNLGDGPDFLLRDVARASSAAPTYFPVAHVREASAPEGSEKGAPSLGQKGPMFAAERILLDGGLFANNPALCAYVEARLLYPEAKSFLIVSLGTGSGSMKWDMNHIARWGYLDWVDPGKGAPLFAMMSRAQAGSADWMLRHLRGVEYIRIDPSLDHAASAIDDASAANLARLRSAASKLIADNEPLLDSLARRL